MDNVRTVPPLAATGKTPKDHLLVFVPGIMGSELFFEGPGHNGGLVRDRIWSGDASTIVNALSRRPKLLWSTEKLVVGEVVRRTGAGVGESLYDDFITFLEGHLHYTIGSDLFLFAYDWRQSNITSAAALATYLRGLKDSRPCCDQLARLDAGSL